MMFFATRGYRVIAHDRRGHGRSTQTWGGHELDTYADDLRALVLALDLRDAIHVGHSTGGGEVARYFGRHGVGRAAKAVLIGAVPPVMVKTDIPVLVMHGDDDQVVPYQDAALKSIKLLRQGVLKIYPGLPHGMASTHAELINADLLAFMRGELG